MLRKMEEEPLGMEQKRQDDDNRAEGRGHERRGEGELF